MILDYPCWPWSDLADLGLTLLTLDWPSWHLHVDTWWPLLTPVTLRAVSHSCDVSWNPTIHLLKIQTCVVHFLLYCAMQSREIHHYFETLGVIESCQLILTKYCVSSFIKPYIFHHYLFTSLLLSVITFFIITSLYLNIIWEGFNN